jgi:hypothetical protein
VATFLTDPTTLDEIVLHEVREHEDRPLGEVLQILADRGYNRSAVKHAFVKLLNEGDLVLTADRTLKTPTPPVSVATAAR